MADETNTEEEANPDASFGKAVGRSIAIGLPVTVVLMIGVLWIFTGDLGEAIGTGILPGVLFGVFAGGFAGTVIAMRRLH
jgi:hypothetical protein